MSSCMTKLEFLLEPQMLFRLGKFSLICYLFCIEFSQALLMSYERFIIILKSRSHTHTTSICTTPTLGVGAKTCHSIQICSKMFYSYTRSEHQKHACQIFHPPNKCSKFLLLSLSKFCCRKVAWGYAKVIQKKEG